MPATHHKASFPQSGLGGDMVTDAQKNADKCRIVKWPQTIHTLAKPFVSQWQDRGQPLPTTHAFLPHPAGRPRCPSAMAQGYLKHQAHSAFFSKVSIQNQQQSLGCHSYSVPGCSLPVPKKDTYHGHKITLQCCHLPSNGHHNNLRWHLPLQIFPLLFVVVLY